MPSIYQIHYIPYFTKLEPSSIRSRRQQKNASSNRQSLFQYMSHAISSHSKGNQKRAFRLRAVNFESAGTVFPFLLICSFFASTQFLPFPFLVIFCFFLGLCLSEIDTCIETCTKSVVTRNGKKKHENLNPDKLNLLFDSLHLHYSHHQSNYLHLHLLPWGQLC